VYDAQLREKAESFAHPIDEVSEKIKVIAESVIKVSVVDHVDAFAFVKLTFHFKEMFIHSSTGTYFIYQPKVLFVFHAIQQHANVFLF
jgi:hypothetical protein